MCDFVFALVSVGQKAIMTLVEIFFSSHVLIILDSALWVFKNGMDGRILKGIGIGYGWPGRGNGKEKEMKMRDGERKRRVMIT